MTETADRSTNSPQPARPGNVGFAKVARQPVAVLTTQPKLGRNDPCTCGSGRKAKHCCRANRLSTPVTPAGAVIARKARPGAPPDPDRALTDTVTPLMREMPTQLQGKPSLQPSFPEQSGSRRPTAAQMRAAASFLQRAVSLRAAGMLSESIPLLQRAIEGNPYDASAHYDLGLTLLKCRRYQDAIASLQHSLALKPDNAKAYHYLGILLQIIGENDPAIAALTRAVTLGPRLADAHWRLGLLLRMTPRYKESVECFRRAAKIAGPSAFGRVCEANALADERKYAEAAALLRHALARDPGDLEANMALANILAIMGDHEEATQQYDRVSAIAPNNVLAMTGKANIKKLTEADQPLIAQMAACLQQAALSDLDRMNLLFALGKACDDRKDYEGAIRHFDMANVFRHRYSKFDRSMFARIIDRAVVHWTPDYFDALAGLGSDDETPLLVLGMPRSGTTLVEQIVSSHPRVADGGELEFWQHHSNTLERERGDVINCEVIEPLAAGYQALLRSISATAARVTDKMPYNFLWIGLVRAAFPKARIIHCRRHPVDTCLSIYCTNFDTRSAFFGDRDDLVFYYRQYLRLMEHWRAVLPPDRFIEVDYETVIAEREAQTRRLIAFCGLEWDDACLQPERNRRVVRTASVWQARQPVYRSSVERWRNYEPWLGALRELLPASQD